jgi:hypothetical protein
MGSETTTAVVIAGAAVFLFILYQNSQQQQAVQNAILLKIATPTQTNPIASLASLVAPILAAI